MAKAEDIIRIENPCCADHRFQDGALPHVTGVKSYQVLRANRKHPELADDYGWTYNHAPMLAWAYGKFFLEYLSNPVDEHEVPGHTMLTTSADGIHWSKPEVIFPSIEIDTTPYKGPKSAALKAKMLTVPHQRMGFYHASNGVLLVLSFYGIVHDRHVSAPCDGWGVGRAVRRIKKDGTVADGTWFLMYNTPAGFTEENVSAFSSYRTSDDSAFVCACDELLQNGAAMRQMYEEQRFDEKLFPNKGAEALSFYTVNHEEMIGVYKKGLVSVSSDQGKTWSDPIRQADICTATGKVWGQKTSDGHYTLMYNPTTDGQHRWPIAAVTGEDGHHFDHMAAITGDMSPQRYGGLDKNLGPQYMRGIAECNTQSPDGDVYLTYSNNKEDIWISRIPVPMTHVGSASGALKFGEGLPTALSVYSPQWCPVEAKDGLLSMKDYDPYDQAFVEVNMCPALSGEISMRIAIQQLAAPCGVTFEVQDDIGRTPIRIVFKPDGWVWVLGDGRLEPWIPYTQHEEMDVTIVFDCRTRRYSIRIGSAEKSFGFSAAVVKLHRFRLKTKEKIPSISTLDANGKYGTKEQILAHCEDPTVESKLEVQSLCWHVAEGGK